MWFSLLISCGFGPVWSLFYTTVILSVCSWCLGPIWDRFETNWSPKAAFQNCWKNYVVFVVHQFVFWASLKPVLKKESLDPHQLVFRTNSKPPWNQLKLKSSVWNRWKNDAIFRGHHLVFWASLGAILERRTFDTHHLAFGTNLRPLGKQLKLRDSKTASKSSLNSCYFGPVRRRF